MNRFVEHYGPTGTWARLFGQAAGYVGTRLLRHSSEAFTFLTIDTWESAADHEAFMSERGDAYRSLDEECESLTEAETLVGSFYSADEA